MKKALLKNSFKEIKTSYKEQNVYDIQIMSTLGLTNSDIDAIKNIENVENVYGTYSEDILVKVNNKELVSKILTIE